MMQCLVFLQYYLAGALAYRCNDLLAHPVVGMSWEGMCWKTCCVSLPERTAVSFYRTATGVEIDLKPLSL